MKVYRFRSMEYLLGNEYQELERQSIYFASPDELNDPMEGLRDIVWRGDKIVWTNFFKHYVYCLNASYPLRRTIYDSLDIDADKMPIHGRWDKPTTLQDQRLNRVWHSFYNLPGVSQMIETLASTDRRIRYRELEFYLRGIQSTALELVIYSSPDIQFMPDSTKQPYAVEICNNARELFKSILFALVVFENANTEEQINALLREKVKLWNNERINRQLNDPDSAGKLDSMDQLSLDFPTVYLKAIEKLLWFDWRTACFTKGYHNSSVWGTYGDSHKGACLIFESVKKDGSYQLELREGEEGKDVPASKFREVVYGGKLNEVDFFRSIGRSTVEQLRELWYTDTKGNISECAAHLPRDGEIDNDDTIAWRKNYWDSFYRNITTKTKDWKYEQEWRLVLEDRSSGFGEEKNHTLTYDLNSLKGIIFGINASDKNRLEAIRIIQKKCEKLKWTHCPVQNDGKISKIVESKRI